MLMNMNSIPTSAYLLVSPAQVRTIVDNAVREAIINLRPPEDRILSTEEAAEFCGLKPQTIRLRVCRNEIPYHKAGERRLRFLESELREWMLNS